MAVDHDPTDVLDLLFDKDEGLLKGDLDDIQTVDFGDLDLLPNVDILHNALFEADIPTAPVHQTEKVSATEACMDHDYFAQKSPSTVSDSGISSGSYSPRSMSDERSQSSPLQECISESPRSNSNLSFEMDNQSPTFQPENSNINTFDMENFDINNLDMDGLDADAIKDFNMEGIDADALMKESDFLNYAGDSDVTINFGVSESDNLINAQQNAAKTVKIIKVSALGTDTLPFTMKDVSNSTDSSQFPELRLTDEERELLSREGVSLPSHMPLTKEEERVLKAVRRKIRNKISAKESRRRKMDYVEGLEKRVKACTQENTQLKKKMDQVEKQNVSLMQQLKKLQALILSKTTKPQASTCIMVLLLSFAFLIVPNFDPFGVHKDDLSDMKTIPIPGNSRSLLHKGNDMTDQDNDPYGLTVKPGPPWEVPPKTPAVSVPPYAQIDTVKENNIHKLINATEIETVYNSLQVDSETASQGREQNGQGEQNSKEQVSEQKITQNNF